MNEIRTGDWEFEEPEKQIKEEKHVLTTEEVAKNKEKSIDENPKSLREQKIRDTLSKLIKMSSEIEASALVSGDGLIMSSVLPGDVEEDKIAAMSAAILSLGEKASEELGKGELTQVFVEGKSGFVFLMSAKGKAVLVAMAGKKAKLGLVFYDMKNIAKEIANLL